MARTVLDPAAICVRPLFILQKGNRLVEIEATYASTMERAHRFKLFAMASNSRS